MNGPKTTDPLFLRLIDGAQLTDLSSKGLQVEVLVTSSRVSPEQCRATVVELIERTNQAQAKAQRLATLGSIGAGLVHEARNVLTAIVGFAQVGKRKEGEEIKDDILETIEGEAKRATEMLAHFLAFARNRPKTMSMFEINEPVSRAKRATEHQLRLHQVGLDVTLSEAPLNVFGSPTEIEQVLVNLILNAQQASEAGGRVEVKVTPGPKSTIHLKVADTGLGIAPGDLERVFDPFFTTKSTGTGLGLAICKRIAQEHDGDLTVTSELGKGTAFSLSLPAVGKDRISS